jgi:hypothetical protein
VVVVVNGVSLGPAAAVEAPVVGGASVVVVNDVSLGAAAAVEAPVAEGPSVVATLSGSLVFGCSGVAGAEDVLALDALG